MDASKAILINAMIRNIVLVDVKVLQAMECLSNLGSYLPIMEITSLT